MFNLLRRCVFVAVAVLVTCDHCPLKAAQVDSEPQRDIEIKMRDGVVTLADLWRPENSQLSFPVILIRTPYGREYETGIAKKWAREGYGVLLQAVRGRDGSEDNWTPWEHELQDGYDTIEWISKQEWCNGKIGMLGGSYLGHVQILAAASGHPALSCIVPISPGSDGFSDVPFSGGVPALGLLGWLHACRGPKLDLSGNYPASSIDRNLNVLPLPKIDKVFNGYESPIWQHWSHIETLADMPGIGLNVWERLEAAEHKVPAFHIDGLWDHESMATRRNWEQFSEHGGPDQYLIFGPWGHDPNKSTRHADVDYGKQAIVDLDGMRKAWYAHWLKDQPDKELDIPNVQIFATGANQWLKSKSWPLENARKRTWYFSGEASRNASRAVAEALLDEEPTNVAQWQWEFDPHADFSRRPDLNYNRTTRLWFDHSDADAIVVSTKRFAEDTLLAGPGKLDLVMETTGKDTDLFAVLVEISPSGEIRAIQRQAQLRLRFREGFDRAVEMPSGQPTKVSLPLGLFAHRFSKGSRLGVAIRSDWFPVYARNLGTLEPNATATQGVKQVNTIQSDAAQPSSLEVYEIPISAIRQNE